MVSTTSTTLVTHLNDPSTVEFSKYLFWFLHLSPYRLIAKCGLTWLLDHCSLKGIMYRGNFRRREMLWQVSTCLPLLTQHVFPPLTQHAPLLSADQGSLVTSDQWPPVITHHQMSIRFKITLDPWPLLASHSTTLLNRCGYRSHSVRVSRDMEQVGGQRLLLSLNKFLDV